MSRQKDPPKFLNLSSDAKIIWKQLFPLLESKGMNDESYHTMLAILCNALDVYEKAQTGINKVIEKTGKCTMTITPKTGNPYEQVIPEISISQKQMELILKYQAKFGFTPADFAKLRLAQPPETDPLKELMEEDEE